MRRSGKLGGGGLFLDQGRWVEFCQILKLAEFLINDITRLFSSKIIKFGYINYELEYSGIFLCLRGDFFCAHKGGGGVIIMFRSLTKFSTLPRTEILIEEYFSDGEVFL